MAAKKRDDFKGKGDPAAGDGLGITAMYVSAYGVLYPSTFERS